MASQKSEQYQPRNVIWRSTDYLVHMQQVLGVADFDNNFDNTFQRWKLIMQFILDVMENIKQETIPLERNERMDLIPDQKAIKKMTKIWEGQTYLALVMSHDNTKVLLKEFFYEEPDPIFIYRDKEGKVVDTYHREIIPMPELKNMLPVGEIKADTWGLQIRETMAVKYAFAGSNYATVVYEGKFMHNLPEGQIPKIKQDEMDSLVLRTPIISRPVYNMIMGILSKYFNENYAIFTANIQKIMLWMEEEDIDMSEIINSGNVTKHESTRITDNQ